MIEFEARPEAIRYLLAQRGDLTAALSSNFDKFRQLWSDEIEKTIKQIGCHPFAPKHVLDIGSGLGLTDMVLNRRFGTFCTLIDGEEPPEVGFKHNVPFCSRRVVDQFWSDNGNTNYQYFSPPQVLNEQVVNATFDLVLSLRSWCFHYPPSVYASFVQEHVADGAVVLLDVRRNRLDTHAEYLATLAKWWPDNEVVETGEKFERIRFVVGGGSYE